jgi:hypothetical protein
MAFAVGQLVQHADLAASEDNLDRIREPLAWCQHIVLVSDDDRFGWSDTWQLVINTGTTIVTFLMVFVIQNTQSRDTQAMQLKLARSMHE